MEVKEAAKFYADTHTEWFDSEGNPHVAPAFGAGAEWARGILHKRFEDTIELHNIILALADDLYTGCVISEYDPIDTPEKKQWFARYCEMKPEGL